MNPEFWLRIIMLVVWLMFLHMCGKGFWKSLASRHWMRVTGTVISTELGERNVGKGVASLPIVTYTYAYQGRPYQSSVFTFLGTAGGPYGGGTEEDARSRLRPYVPGRLVDVFVNPHAPAEAVLVPGVHWVQYVAFFLLTTFCVGLSFIVDILNFIWPGCQPNCR